MLKALSITGSNSHQSATGRYGRSLTRIAALAAAAFLAFAAGEAVASARLADRTPTRVNAQVQQAGWENRGSHLRLQRVVPRAHHPRAHHPRVHHHKFHKRQGFHRHGHRKLHHKGRRHYGRWHYGGACRPVKFVGWHRGHRALFGEVLCVNRFGQLSTLRGSRYLIRYLHH